MNPPRSKILQMLTLSFNCFKTYFFVAGKEKVHPNYVLFYGAVFCTGVSSIIIAAYPSLWSTFTVHELCVFLAVCVLAYFDQISLITLLAAS